MAEVSQPNEKFFYEDENKIVIEAGLAGAVFPFLDKASRVLVIFGFLAYGIILEVDGILGVVIALFALILGWELMSLIEGRAEVFYCLIDKSNKIITISKGHPRLFWRPTKAIYKFEDLKSITLGGDDDMERKLSFGLRGDYGVTLAGSVSVTTAETISKTLQIPLKLKFGDEYLVHVPWEPNRKSNLIPTPCLSCGASLPKIDKGVQSAKCSHCGMTMVVQWEKDRFSYRKQVG